MAHDDHTIEVRARPRDPRELVAYYHRDYWRREIIGGPKLTGHVALMAVVAEIKRVERERGNKGVAVWLDNRKV